jgi:cobalt-zinc-cadmium resistance protein CzcA
MLRRLIRFALTQRLLILSATALMVAGGVWAYLTIPIGAYPDISTTQVQVIVKAPGMAPEDVEKRVTRPLEIEVRSIPKQTMLRSITKRALAVLTIDFEEGTDIYWARQQVSERISDVLTRLPEGVHGGLAPITSPLSELYMFMVESESHDLRELRTILDWMIRPRLVSLDGVAGVNALGGYAKAFAVEPRPDALRAYNLTVSDVVRAIKSHNRNAGGGRIVRNDQVLLVRSLGRLETVADIAGVPVATKNGVPINIDDLASVRIGSRIRYGGVTKNGKGEGVQGLVLLRTGANGRKTVTEVKKRLEEIKETLPKGVHLTTVYDRSVLIEEAVDTVELALAEGIALVLIVLSLFLGNLRSAVTTGLILPLTMIGAFLLMRVFGVSANLMSLGGLAIAVGILVDSSVVVAENIHTRLSEPHHGFHPLHIVYRAAGEVARPVLSAVLIIVASFIPILSLTGVEGKLFSPLALTICFALLVSLLLSLTVIPVVASLLMKGSPKKKSRIVDALLRAYRPVLGWALRHRVWALGIALFFLAGSGALVPFIGREFLPTLDEGTIVIQTEKIPSISLEKSIEIDLKVQKALMEIDEVTGVYSRVGSDELRLDPMGFHETDAFLRTKPPSEWEASSPDELRAKLRKVMEGFPGLSFGFTQPIDMRVSEMLTGVRATVGIKLFGESLEVLDQKARKLETIVKNTPGAVDVMRTPLGGQRYLHIAMRHDMLERHGISVETINQLIETAVGGSEISEIVEGNRTFPILVRFPEESRKSVDDLERLIVETPQGAQLRLHQLAEIEEVEGPVQIEREMGKRFVLIQSNVKGRDVVGFVKDLRSRIAEAADLPAGYYVTFGGQFENEQRASRRLALAGPAALLFVFLLLFSTFGSVRQAGLILINVPFALIGGVLLMFASGLYLSVPASVGFIALFGVAIENGVVLVNHFNDLRKQGVPISQAVRQGSERRLRPVLMTAILTILGLVPLLLATGPGSEIQKPLAVVVVGGTFSSLLLTLILLPTLYDWMEGRKERQVKVDLDRVALQEHLKLSAMGEKGAMLADLTGPQGDAEKDQQGDAEKDQQGDAEKDQQGDEDARDEDGDDQNGGSR